MLPERQVEIGLCFGQIADVRFILRPQPVNATHALNCSAGVSKPNVFLGCSLSRLATAFNFA